MKILFQGGWKENRDLPQNKSIIEDYCKSLARYIVETNHTIVLTSNRDYEMQIALEIEKILSGSQEKLKRQILFLLPDSIQTVPKIGTVHKFGRLKWWQEERTYFIKQVDSLIAIGGGKGTSDCIEKAILANLPVFVAGQIDCTATKTWKQRPLDYKYFKENDTGFTEDLNTSPEMFFNNVFNILKKQSDFEFSRNVFIVHGRNHYERDKLVSILKKT